MMHSKGGRRLLACLGVIALSAALSACGSNNGGATTCGDYLQLSSDGQKAVITSFLESKGDSNPAGGMVILNQQSAKLFCSTVGTSSDPISKIDGN